MVTSLRTIVNNRVSSPCGGDAYFTTAKLHTHLQDCQIFFVFHTHARATRNDEQGAKRESLYLARRELTGACG